MDEISGRTSDFQWLLEEFVQATPGVTEAVAASSDGLMLGASSRSSGKPLEQLAALAAGVQSLARGVSDFLEFSETDRVIIEMKGGLMFVARISSGSVLAVVAAPDADYGQIGYEMTVLVERVGQALTPELISHLKNSLPV
ncbi:MAG: roadblock/LC7 domain-containing protein [Acidimicrobiales bacterium]